MLKARTTNVLRSRDVKKKKEVVQYEETHKKNNQRHRRAFTKKS